MSETIYHITSRVSWLAARKLGAYTADSLANEGFIHCSKEEQVLRVANSFFAGQTGLVLLIIDLNCLTAELRWEPGLDWPVELFPHIYGPLNLDAVVCILDFPPAPDGRWEFLPG